VGPHYSTLAVSPGAVHTGRSLLHYNTCHNRDCDDPGRALLRTSPLDQYRRRDGDALEVGADDYERPSSRTG
jgi:hypothetical protein